jgi:hypothetical protein
MATSVASDVPADNKVDQSQPDEYAVEAISEKRLVNGKAEYLVKWKGFDV